MKTEYTEETLKLLADTLRERPKDFDFSDIQGEVTGKSSTGTSATLRQMLGAFEWAGRDDVSGTVFYGRKPKLRGLERIIDLINTQVVVDQVAVDQDSIAAMRVIVRKSCEVCALLLYVQAGEVWRAATPDEVADAFDLAELNTIRDRFSGLTVTETPEGNA
jgi:hypothetical protein